MTPTFTAEGKAGMKKRYQEKTAKSGTNLMWCCIRLKNNLPIIK